MPIPQALVAELTAHLAGKVGSDFVFTSSRGGPLRHSNFYARHFRPAVLRAGLPAETRFHDLRHSYAAMLIADGAYPRAIMERLGHSTIQVTLGTYGHVFPSLEASLTAALDDVYRSAEPAGFGQSARDRRLTSRVTCPDRTIWKAAHRETHMAESLQAHAQDLADYLNDNVLDHDDLSLADIPEALASLGITLVEDLVSDSTHTYYETLRPGEELDHHND